jgi:hypothetical protein
MSITLFLICIQSTTAGSSSQPAMRLINASTHNNHIETNPPLPSMVAYRDELVTRIKRVWIPPRDGGICSLFFEIHSDGSIANLEFSHQSPYAGDNQAIIKAIRSSAPFPPLPKGQDSILVMCRFTAPPQICFDSHECARTYREALAALESKQLLLAIDKLQEVVNFSGGANSFQHLRATSGLDKLGAGPLYDESATCQKYTRDLSNALLAFAQTQFKNPKLVRNYLYKALFTDSDNMNARDLLNQQLKDNGINPQSADTRLKLAKAALDRGHLEVAAVELHEAAIAQSQTAATAHALLELDRQLSNAKNLIYWHQIVDANKKSVQGHLGLGETFEQQGKHDKARREFKRALDLDPSCIDAKRQLKNY